MRARLVIGGVGTVLLFKWRGVIDTREFSTREQTGFLCLMGDKLVERSGCEKKGRMGPKEVPSKGLPRLYQIFACKKGPE